MFWQNNNNNKLFQDGRLRALRESEEGFRFFVYVIRPGIGIVVI